MSYIGRGVDAISNVEKLDNITFSGTTTYALTKSSAAFTPVGANNLLISIDGVIQQGNFSVSTTNIVFDWSPTSSNTCDFVLHYGTGVLNVPADGAVSTAKIADDAVTLAKMAGLARGKIIYGDASGNPAALTVGSNTQVLKSDGTDISWGADAGFDVSTITGATALTTQPAATDEIVLSDAGTLKRLDIKHIQNTPAFVAYNADTQSGVSDNTRTKVAFTEVLDTDTAYASDTTFTPGVAGYYFLTAQARVESSDASAAYSANIVIYKNGSEIPDAGGGKMFIDGGSHALAKRFSITCNTIVYLDADDYVELYIGMDTNSQTVNVDDDGHFSGFRIAGI